MKQVAELAESMKRDGIIRDYAVFGAVAQMRYTEPVATLDADLLVELPDARGLAPLSPIYDYCQRLGHKPQGEAILVGDWPVQFIPVFSELTREAVHEAETADIDGSPFRVVQASHLAVIALSVGRPKDLLRIHSLIHSGAVTASAIEPLANRHGLSNAWKQFQIRFS